MAAIDPYRRLYDVRDNNVTITYTPSGSDYSYWDLQDFIEKDKKWNKRVKRMVEYEKPSE